MRPNMAMVALAPLIIVTDQPLSGHSIKESILETMLGWWNRMGDTPNNDFLNRSVIKDDFI